MVHYYVQLNGPRPMRIACDCMWEWSKIHKLTLTKRTVSNDKFGSVCFDCINARSLPISRRFQSFPFFKIEISTKPNKNRSFAVFLINFYFSIHWCSNFIFQQFSVFTRNDCASIVYMYAHGSHQSRLLTELQFEQSLIACTSWT